MEIIKKSFQNKAVLIRGYYVGVLVAKNPEVISFDQGKLTLMSNETIQLYNWEGLKKGNINEIPDLTRLEGAFILNKQPTLIMEGFQYTIISDTLYNHILKNCINK